MSGNVVIVYGYQGWIGGMVVDLLKKESRVERIVLSQCRVGNDPDSKIIDELDQEKPTHAISLVGRTHGPGYSTIDYLEVGGPEKLKENVRDNLYAPVVLSLLCSKRGIHFTSMGTGCIFKYIDNNYLGEGVNEEEIPNFFGSSYSVVKGFTDRLLHHMNVLNVRIRMPVSDDWSARNFIVKIKSYEKVVNIPNSITVLPELLPLMIDMSLRKEVGTINLVNPDSISHNEILEMYKEIIDPSFVINNFTVEEQSKILKADRSNCKLDASKLCLMYQGKISNSRDAVRRCIEKMKKTQ